MLLFEALRLAIEMPADSVFVEWYLEDGGDPNCWDLLHIAAANGREEIAQMLIRAGADLEKCHAVHELPGSLYHYNSLEDSGFERWPASLAKRRSQFDGMTPLQIAACRGNINLALALLEAGADINNSGRTGLVPLRCALHHPDPDCKLLKILIDKGAGMDQMNLALEDSILGLPDIMEEESMPTLNMALEADRVIHFEDRLRKACYLIQRGAVVGQGPEGGQTLLHKLAFGLAEDMYICSEYEAIEPIQNPREIKSMLDFFRLVIDAGFDVNTRDSQGRRAIDYCGFGEAEAVLQRFLLSRLIGPERDRGLAESEVRGFVL